MNEYIEVDLRVLRVYPNSIIVEGPDGDVVIGRSCIYGPDEQDLEDLDVPDDVTLRVFRWLANKEGLL
jgi:hypothetical protein